MQNQDQQFNQAAVDSTSNQPHANASAPPQISEREDQGLLSNSLMETRSNVSMLTDYQMQIDTTMTPEHPAHLIGDNSDATQPTSISLDDIKVSIDAKNLALTIHQALDAGQEPVDLLRELNGILSHQYPRIVLELQSVALSDRLQFYTTVFKTTADKFLQTKTIVLSTFLPQIFKFFRNVLVNFFPEDIEQESLADIVHSIFNLEAPLYTLALQNSYIKQLNQIEVDIMSIEDEDLTLDQRRIKKEFHWRQSINVGTRLDAVIQIQQLNSKINQWVKGTVVQVFDDNYLVITFDQMSNKFNRSIGRMDKEIAMPNTYTNDQEWKLELEENDQIDAMDAEGIWYRSTVLKTKIVDDDCPLIIDGLVQPPKQIKKALVGYRVYDDEEGHKLDDDGRKFLGWSFKYDVWFAVYDPHIQRHRSMVKHYSFVGKDMIYDNVVDDMQDILQNTKERKVWAVFRNNFFSNLRCIPDYFNEFGLKSGFEKILIFLNNPQAPKTLRQIFLLVDFLSKSQPLWHHQFASYFIPRLLSAVQTTLLTPNDQKTSPIQQKFSKESLGGFQKALQSILRRHFTSVKYNVIISELNFDIGFMLIKSDKLEQRIQGIKEIVEQIKNTKYSNRKTLSAKEVMMKLKSENILEKIFGENYHIQIIQRSADIIKFYINEKEITEKEIDQIWQATKRDQQTKLEIYKIIQDCAMQFKHEEAELLVAKFAQVAPEDFVEKEIECVYEMSKFYHKQVNFIFNAAQLFWDIAVQERPYRKQIIELAIDKFIDLVRNFERPIKFEYIQRCIAKIRQNQASIQSIKIIQKILEQIPNYRAMNQATLFDVSNDLIQQEDLINLVIYDLISYSDIINELWNKKVITEANIDQTDVLDLPFTHRSQAYVRLNFIRQMLQNSQTQLDENQLDQIWDLLMVRSKVSSDSDIFFDWFKTLLQDQNKLSSSLILHFFQTKVCSKEVNFNFIKKSGFDCIKNIFLKINEEEDKIQVIVNPGVGNNALNQKLEIKVLEPPNSLVGIDVIWKLLSDCDKRNADLVALIIELITKVYHSLSPSLEAEKHQIEEQFCRDSIERISNVVDNSEITDVDKRNFVKSCTIMLKSFFADSEKNGCGDMKPFYALEKFVYVENLIIQNAITSNKQCPKYIQLNVYSNMTIWQLKKLVASKLNISPLRLQLIRQDSKKKQITDSDNCEIIRKFMFDQYEMLNAQKKPQIYLSRVPLLNKRKELVPEAKAIFESWFKKFSNEDGFMTPLTCVDFIKSSTSDQAVTESDQRIVRLFKSYDLDQDQKLSIEDFVIFYTDSCRDRLELVWSNLHTNKIGHDLKPITQQDDRVDKNEVKDPSVLPRFKLSQDQDLFNHLFSLFDKMGFQAQNDLRDFIGTLRINPYIYSKMLSLSGQIELVEEQSLDKILYNLEIFNALINQHSTLKDQIIKSYYYESQEYNVNFPSLEQNQKHSSVVPPIQYQSDNLNEQARDQQSAAPVSGAIPLHAAGPVMVSQGNHIPDAPPIMGMDFIGPPLPPANHNSNQSSSNASGFQNQAAGVTLNNMKNKELLENFKGDIVTEPYSDEILADEEVAKYFGTCDILEVQELKQSFMQSFVTNDGFKILLQLLEKILNIAKGQPDDKLFENKAQKDCMQYILKIMRVLLLTSFIGNSEQPELNLELTKRLSQNNNLPSKDADKDMLQFTDLNDLESQIFNQDGAVVAQVPFVNDLPNRNKNNKDDKKNKIQSEKDDLEALYQPLTNLLRGELGRRILKTVDFNQLQKEIFDSLLLLFKKKTLYGTDMENVQMAIQLWISTVLYNQNMIQDIIDDQNRSDQAGQQSMLLQLIEKGLLSGEMKAKHSIEEALKFLFVNLKTNTLSEAPYLFLLRVMISNVKITQKKQNNSRYFYNLLVELLEKYFDSKNKQALDFQEIINTKELLHEFIIQLDTYQSQESKYKQYQDDQNQVGYLQVIEVMLKNEPYILDLLESRNLAKFLIEKCLFCMDIPSIQDHYRKTTNLKEHEKPFLNKCNSNSSREKAYNLLKRISNNYPELIPELLTNYFHPYIYKITKPKRPNYSPRNEVRGFHGFCGIRNLGSICYMNSMIQQFFHIPAFRYCLMSTQDNQPDNLQTFEERPVDDNMLHQLIKFMGFLELSERQDYDPRDFCFSFKDFAGQPTNVRIQQDTQEFLNLAFDRIERQLANTSQKYLLNNIFQGQTCSLMICKNCGNLRQNRDNFYNLSLEVKNQKTIYDSLKKFITGEIINDFKCEACNQKVDIERRSVIEKLPNMLMVHLQRIIFDFDTFQNVKLNTKLEFPNILNLKPYMLSEILKQEKDLLKKSKKDEKKLQKQRQKEELMRQQVPAQEEGKIEENSTVSKDAMEIQEPHRNDSPQKGIIENESSDDEEMEIDGGDSQDIPDEEFQFKLVGVVVHMGTAQAGHYVSYINIKRGEKDEEDPEWQLTDKDKWLEFNDSTVKDYRFSNLEEDCFGGVGSGQGGNNMMSSEIKSDYTKNAYVLIYEKRRKEKIKIVIPEELVNQSSSLGCDGTAIPREDHSLSQQINTKEDHHFLQVLPQTKEILINREGIIHFDEEKKEHYVLVDFNSAQQFVPHDIYRQVHDDNVLYLRERQILHNVFFETQKSIFEKLLETQPALFGEESLLASTLFDMLQRMLFELLPFTTENSQYKDLYKIFLRGLSLNHNMLFTFIDKQILVDKSKLQKDERTFIENMIQNIDSEKRETNKNTLLFIINTLFQLEKYDKIDAIMQPIFAMIPDDFSKNWLKIGHVLTLIFEITKSGHAQFCYMVNNGIVTKLIDLFMETDSPKNYARNRQLMGSNYATPMLDSLILTLSYIVRHYPNINLPSSQPSDYDQFLTNFRHIPSGLYMTDFQGQELPPLSEEDLFMLSQKLLYARNLKSGYERVEFGRMICHLSYLNFEFSKRVCKVLLIGLNKATQEEIQIYLQTISGLLCFNDPLIHVRLVWLLGYPQLKLDVQNIFEKGQTITKLKLGVSQLYSATDDVFEYRSPLFKQEQAVKESYLQLLYQYRKRWPKLVYQQLYYMLDAYPLSPALIQYIKTMEPTSYIYGRYKDWVLPYLEEQIQLNSGNSESQVMERTLMIQISDVAKRFFADDYSPLQQQVQPSQAQIDTNLANNQNQDQPQSNNQDKKQVKEKFENYSYSSLDGGPDQYLIWNIVEERVIDERIIPEHNIELAVREVTVRITESRPDGTNNKIFAPNQFTRHRGINNNNNLGGDNYNQRGLNDAQLSSSKKSRQYGRSQRTGGQSNRNKEPHLPRGNNVHQDGPYVTVDKNPQFQLLKPIQSRIPDADNQTLDEEIGGQKDDFNKFENQQDSSVQVEDYDQNPKAPQDEFENNSHGSDYPNNLDDVMDSPEKELKQKSQDNSMEVEYNQDNQDQSEYFNYEAIDSNNPSQQNNHSQNFNEDKQNQRYQDKQQLDDYYSQGAAPQDPQEINLLSDLDQEQDDQNFGSAGPAGVVPQPQRDNKHTREHKDQEEAMEQDDNLVAASQNPQVHYQPLRQTNNADDNIFEKGNNDDNEYPAHYNQDQQQNSYYEENDYADRNNNNDNQQDDLLNVENEYGDPDVWEASQACVMIFTVRNLDQMIGKTVRLHIKDLTKLGEQPLNFRNPLVLIKALVMGGRTRDIFVLTKLRPFDSWGSYEYTFDVQEPKQRGLLNQGASQRQAFNVAGAGNMSDIGNNQNHDNQNYQSIVLPLPQNEPKYEDAQVQDDMLDTDSKPCPVCTFLNIAFLTQCEVCGSNLN